MKNGVKGQKNRETLCAPGGANRGPNCGFIVDNCAQNNTCAGLNCPSIVPAPLTGPSRDVTSSLTYQNKNFMAVRIRLKRVGAKNSPVFRVVVADARSPRDGKFIEELGTYHPLKKGDDNYTLNLERARYWIGVGALPSETVHSMIKRAGRKATA